MSNRKNRRPEAAYYRFIRIMHKCMFDEHKLPQQLSHNLGLCSNLEDWLYSNMSRSYDDAQALKSYQRQIFERLGLSPNMPFNPDYDVIVVNGMAVYPYPDELKHYASRFDNPLRRRYVLNYFMGKYANRSA